MQLQRINVSSQAVEEVVSDAARLAFVKMKSGQQIPIRRTRDLNLHFARRRNDFLATSHSMNSSSPATTRASVARNSRRCQAGERKLASSRERSAHNSSITRNLSTLVIDLSGRVIGIGGNLGASLDFGKA